MYLLYLSLEAEAGGSGTAYEETVRDAELAVEPLPALHGAMRLSLDGVNQEKPKVSRMSEI